MTDKLREAAQQAPMAYYALVIKADSGYESTTEGRCTADQYGAAMAALHGTAALAQQGAQKPVGDALRGRICGYTPGVSRIEVQLPEGTLITGWLELGETVYIATEAHQTTPPAQQDAQEVPTQRQYKMALRQWESWKAYALELQAKLVKYEGGSPMVLNTAPTPPAQRVMLTDEEIDEVWNSIAGHSIYAEYQMEIANAMIEAYERKNGIK